MRLAIHDSDSGFHPRWVGWCEEHGIEVKRVNCHASDIVSQLSGCDGLLWHHSQMNPADLLVAKGILQALEHTGFQVFPDWRTAWHFDDKLSQKYLFEALDFPFLPTWAFLDRGSALAWIEQAQFPKVFKLRGGAGSANVRLVRTRAEARKLVRQAFGRGFPNYDAWGSLKERWRKVRLRKTSPIEILKGIARFAYPPGFCRVLGREYGYVYFQEFIDSLSCDYRTIVIGKKCLSIKRNTRDNDFRASGSGLLEYSKSLFEKQLIQTSFECAERLGSKCAAMDFIISEGKFLLVEVSYGFPTGPFAQDCPGYWDRSFRWQAGAVDPQGWMLADFVESLKTAGE